LGTLPRLASFVDLQCSLIKPFPLEHLHHKCCDKEEEEKEEKKKKEMKKRKSDGCSLGINTIIVVLWLLLPSFQVIQCSFPSS
jgi:hypothetical protein